MILTIKIFNKINKILFKRIRKMIKIMKIQNIIVKIIIKN
jgi:hypothetical protein